MIRTLRVALVAVILTASALAGAGQAVAAPEPGHGATDLVTVAVGGWCLAGLVVLAVLGVLLLRSVPRTRGCLEVVATEPGARRSLGSLDLRRRRDRIRSGTRTFLVSGADVALRVRGVRLAGRPGVHVHVTVRPHRDGPLTGPVRRAAVNVPAGGRRLVLGLEVIHHAEPSDVTDWPGVEPPPDESRTVLVP